MACSNEISVLVYFKPQTVFDFLRSKTEILEFAIKSIDKNNHTIYLKGGLNVLSWGEKIIIKIVDDANNNAKVIISSKSAMPTTIIDWGRNKQNVERIGFYILNSFPSQKPHI